MTKCRLPLPIASYTNHVEEDDDDEEDKEEVDDDKDTINCPEKLMKISHFDQTNQCLLSIL